LEVWIKGATFQTTKSVIVVVDLRRGGYNMPRINTELPNKK
jgi:hypothetical protein